MDQAQDYLSTPQAQYISLFFSISRYWPQDASYLMPILFFIFPFIINYTGGSPLFGFSIVVSSFTSATLRPIFFKREWSSSAADDLELGYCDQEEEDGKKCEVMESSQRKEQVISNSIKHGIG